MTTKNIPMTSGGGGGTPIISTALTFLLRVRHPIIGAPMCGFAMGKLAGCVAARGGVGLIGAGAGTVFGPERIRAEFNIAREEIIKKTRGEEGRKDEGEVTTDCPGALGVGFLEGFMQDKDDTFDVCMSLKPDVVWFGGFTAKGETPEKWMNRVRAQCSSARIIVQAFTVQEAVTAASLGADAVVIQGCDAGGHGRQTICASIVSLIPQTRLALQKAGFDDCVLIAAGGIATGRQMAAALTLGADGVAMGSAFVVTKESLASDPFKQRIIDTEDGTSGTVASQVWDHLSSTGRPFVMGEFTGRALCDSETVQRYADKDPGQLTDDDKEWYAKSDYSSRAVWCSTSSGLLNELQIGAGELVERTVKEAIIALNERTHFQIKP